MFFASYFLFLVSIFSQSYEVDESAHKFLGNHIDNLDTDIFLHNVFAIHI